MDKTSAIFKSLGPMQDYGLEKEDPTFGMNQPTLEGDVHSRNPGPDRTHPTTQEQSTENYDDNVRDYRADILRQLELSRDNVGGVIVKPAPLRMAAEEKVKDSVYSKIVSAMKRLAADAEKPATAPGAEEELAPYTESGRPAPSESELAKKIEEETALQLQQEQAWTEEQRRQQQEKIDEKYGKPEEQTRQVGPARDLSRHKSVKLNPGDRGYDALVSAIEEVLDIRSQMVEAMDRHITESESILRRARVLKDAFSAPKDLAGAAYEKYNQVAAPVVQVLDKILAAKPGLRRVDVAGDAGTSARVKTLKGKIDTLGLEGLMNAVMDPKALAGILDKMRTSEDVSAEGKLRAAELEKLAKENPKQLRNALKNLLDMFKKNAKAVMDAEAKVSKLDVLFAPRAEKLNARLAQVLARAKEYDQSINDIAEKYRVSDAELNDAKVKLAEMIGRLEKVMGVASSLQGATTKESSLAVRIAADSWAKTMADIDEMSFQAESAFDDLGIFDKASSIINVFSQADEALSVSDSVMDSLEPLVEAMSSDSVALEAPTDEVIEFPSDAPEKPEESASEGIWDSMMQALAPAQPAYAMAAEQAKIIRLAVEKKKKGESPSEMDPIGTTMPSDEELKKQPMSLEELNKAKLPREQALSREKSRKEREDKASAKPSAQEKALKRATQAAVKQMAKELVPQEQLDAFVSSHRLARENAKQLGDGLKEAKEILAATEAEVAPEYTAARAEEEGEESASHHARRREVDAQYVELADKLLSANDKVAAALREASPENDKRIVDSIVTLGNAYKIVLDVDADQAILSNPDLAGDVEDSLELMLRAFGKHAKKMPNADEAVAEAKILKRFADLASDVKTRYYSRSTKRSTTEVEHVEKTMGPAIQKSLTEVLEQAPMAAEPLATEGENPEMPLSSPESSEGKEAALAGMSRSAEDDESLLKDMQELLDMMPQAADAYETVDSYLAAAVEMAEDMKGPLEKLTSLVESARSAPADESEESGDWVSDAASWAKDWASRAVDSITPQAPALAPAYVGASKSEENTMERVAGEYDKFDVSKNRLEIVEGEDGTRKLVVNRGLKNLVSKRVRDMISGGFKCGDDVQVDLVDHIGFGTVKAYLGSGVYRVEVDGAVMEVPAKNVLGLDGSPWRI